MVKALWIFNLIGTDFSFSPIRNFKSGWLIFFCETLFGISISVGVRKHINDVIAALAFGLQRSLEFRPNIHLGDDCQAREPRFEGIVNPLELVMVAGADRESRFTGFQCSIV